MGFELFFIAADNATRLPAATDLIAAFDGYVREELPPPSLETLARVAGQGTAERAASLPPFRTLILGDGLEQTSLTFESLPEDSAGHSQFSVERPTDAGWLWDRLYRLLADFDMFMAYPSDEMTPAYARDGIEIPEALAESAVVVRSGVELMNSIR